MVEPKPLEAASTERSTSAEVDLTLALPWLEAATRAFCAVLALLWIALCAALAAPWMVSAALVVTLASDRSISAEIDLIWLADSPELVSSERSASVEIARSWLAASAE